MSISFKCPQCDHGYKVDDGAAGKRAKCAKCGATMTVPEPEPAAPSLLSELLDSEEGESSSQTSHKLELGYSIQPSANLDDEEDDFELEPPITPPVVMPFLDDDSASVSGSPETAKRSAATPKTAPKTPKPQQSSKSAFAAADDLVVDEDREPEPPPEKKVPCPSCNEPIKEGSVLCIHCGLNLRTGEKVESAVTKKGGLGRLLGGFRREK